MRRAPATCSAKQSSIRGLTLTHSCGRQPTLNVCLDVVRFPSSTARSSSISPGGVRSDVVAVLSVASPGVDGCCCCRRCYCFCSMNNALYSLGLAQSAKLNLPQSTTRLGRQSLTDRRRTRAEPRPSHLASNRGPLCSPLFSSRPPLPPLRSPVADARQWQRSKAHNNRLPVPCAASRRNTLPVIHTQLAHTHARIVSRISASTAAFVMRPMGCRD